MVADQLQGAAAYGAAIENPAMPSTTIATSTPGASDLPTYLNHDEQATNHLPPLRHSFPTLPPPSASPMADMLEGSSRLAELAHASHHLPRLYASRQDSEPVAIRKSVEPSLGRADAMGQYLNKLLHVAIDLMLNRLHQKSRATSTLSLLETPLPFIIRAIPCP